MPYIKICTDCASAAGMESVAWPGQMMLHYSAASPTVRLLLDPPSWICYVTFPFVRSPDGLKYISSSGQWVPTRRFIYWAPIKHQTFTDAT